jgi:hypothetical protein
MKSSCASASAVAIAIAIAIAAGTHKRIQLKHSSAML